ncbi:MAG: endonuclease [Bacteroidales bacterium]|nr:endonuclease [Bacteroidales bacterium]
MKRFAFIILVSLLSLNCAGAQESEERDEDIVRIATYNVGIFDKYRESGYRMTARMMRELNPDVLVLNELDSCTFRTGKAFQMRRFLRRMGSRWDGLFAPALKPFQTGAYGIAEVWNGRKRSVEDSFTLVLPKGEGAEPRALVVVEYEDMVVAGTHLEHTKESARIAQIEVITSVLKDRYGRSGKPVFLCGDMNAGPESGTLKLLKEDWTVLTPAKTTFPDKAEISGMTEYPDSAEDVPGSCIDYILQLNNGVECEVVATDVCVRFESGSAFTASDHFPVFVDLRLP